VEVEAGETGLLVVVVVLSQSLQLGSYTDEVVAGLTGVEVVLSQSLQLGSYTVVLAGLTGLVVVVEAETQSLQVWSAPPGPPLYGQLVTVGSHEVMVTSTVSVMVVVPA
jgi:hypothetical protein